MANKLPSPPENMFWMVDPVGPEPSICLVEKALYKTLLCFPAPHLESESAMADVVSQVEQMKEEAEYFNSLKQLVEEANNG